MPLPADALHARARNVRLLLLDVDGVLTDGSIVLGGDSEAKSFYIRDGAALVWARREGLEVALLSGRPSAATARRADELGITTVIQGVVDKRQAYDELRGRAGLKDDEVAYMGDDWLDLPILKRVGLSAAPADAAEEVRARVHWVSGHAGGRGAVRDLVELLLRARQRWDGVLAGYLS